jgi:hypothetical protein
MAGNYVQQGLDWLTGTDRDEEDRVEARKARGKAAFDRAAGQPFGENPHLAFAMNTAQQGMQNQASAAGAINSAISNEMNSRVAQAREQRRMEHEKELARMRMQMEREKTEAMIRRLGQEQDPMPPGMISRIRIDGRGRVTHG